MANDNKELKIVAVSGGFDPIHIGHVRLFQEAKKLGDRLIVILNNDNWLMAKKGSVFMRELERKEILEALFSVDEVVLTNHAENPQDMSVCQELLQLQPNVFANGGDRHKNNIPEVGVCKAIGCEMVFNVGKGGKIQSSSWLLNKHARNEKLREQARAASLKTIIMFDLDGTLTKNKASLDREMNSLLCELLEKKIVVVSGGNYAQFEKQILGYLKCPKDKMSNLFILPTSGASLYRHQRGGWHEVYKQTLTPQEKKKILAAFQKAFRDINYSLPEKTYGRVIEDRESQITFSALGQKASLARKEAWNKKYDVRTQLKFVLEKYLSEFEIRFGGLTSIDVTKKGIDKAYGISRILKMLALSKEDIVYVGDALYESGNDYVVKSAGVDTIEVKDEKDAKNLIRFLISFIKHATL